MLQSQQVFNVDLLLVDVSMRYGQEEPIKSFVSLVQVTVYGSEQDEPLVLDILIR